MRLSRLWENTEPNNKPITRVRQQSSTGKDSDTESEGSEFTDGEDEEWEREDKPRFSFHRFMQVGLVVVTIVAISLGPFIYLSQASPFSVDRSTISVIMTPLQHPTRSGRYCHDCSHSDEVSAMPTGHPTSGLFTTSSIRCWLRVRY